MGVVGYFHSGYFVQPQELSEHWVVESSLKENTSRTSSDTFIRNGQLYLGKTEVFQPTIIRPKSTDYQAIDIHLESYSGLLVGL